MKLTNKIQKAINKSSELHLGQTRKGGGLPYVVHPFSVAWIASEYTTNENIICACFLHDVFEDVDKAKYSENEMLKDFGEEVVRLVYSVSEDKDANISKKEEKISWKDRKLGYVAKLKNHNEDSLIISCADKIHNLQSLILLYKKEGESIWVNFNAPGPKKENSIWFHDEILSLLQKRLNNDIVREYEVLIKEVKKILKI